MTKKDQENQTEGIPRCVGIIMDGNRRWAKRHGMPAIAGHRYGANTLKEVVRWSADKGISHLIVYAFSSENWNRSPVEVKHLMGLLKRFFDENMAMFAENGVRIRCIGTRERFSPEMQRILQGAEEQTVGNTSICVTVALSYGGRAEILHAVQRISENVKGGGTAPNDEKAFSQYLWTHDIPDPDVIIRTGGEQRLSNFLPWQSVYSELVFVDTLWPSLSKKEYDGIIAEYTQRKRNFGK